MKIIEFNLQGRTHCTVDASVQRQIADKIDGTDADLCVMTETPVKYALNELNEKYFVFTTVKAKKYPVKICIAKEQILHGTEPTVEDLSDGDIDLLAVSFSTVDGRLFTVVGCRFLTGLNEEKAQYDSQRKALDERLMPIVNDFAEKSDVCVVAGDFNNASCYGDLNRQYDKKDYIKYGKELDQINFNLNLLKDAFDSAGFTLADDTKNGIPTKDKFPIDHIFVKGSRVNKGYPIDVSPHISDHRMIAAEISL